MEQIVDIIVAIYNQEKCIEKCIKSIMHQSYNTINIILVDDGSTDHSLDICMRYMRGDSRIKVYSKTNGGVASARNEGLKHLEGSKLVFVDSDDYIKEDYIMCLMNHGDYDFVISGNEWVNKDDEVIIKNMPTFFESSVRQEWVTYIHKKENFKYFTSPWGKLFKLSLINEHNILFRNLNYGEDTCFVFDYLQYINNIKVISDTEYCYYILQGSLSRKNIESIWYKLKDINEYCKKNFYEEYDEIWNYMYLRIVKVALANHRNNRESFKNQFNEIRKDQKYKYLSVRKSVELSEKIICILIKMNLKNVYYVFQIMS